MKKNRFETFLNLLGLKEEFFNLYSLTSYSSILNYSKHIELLENYDLYVFKIISNLRSRNVNVDEEFWNKVGFLWMNVVQNKNKYKNEKT